MFFKQKNRQPQGGVFLFGMVYISLKLWGELVTYNLSLFILPLTVSFLDCILDYGNGVRINWLICIQ